MTQSSLSPIYVVGPTASGKSALALKLARAFDGIIISADSMQIYKCLDIGTAKPTASERMEVEHKMIDILQPWEEFSVAQYALMANEEILNAQKRGKLPLIVGGTGLYFEALLYPMRFGNTCKNPELRQLLLEEAERDNGQKLHEKLSALDPATAKRLHPNDVKRVIRALEIVLTTGKTLAQNGDERKDPDVIMIGLNADRGALYDRINQRVDKMFDRGLVQEVYSVGNFDYQSMQAIGYKEFSAIPAQKVDGNYVLDKQTLDEVKDKIKQHTRNYAKRQLTWFRKYPFVKWFDVDDFDGAESYIRQQLTR